MKKNQILTRFLNLESQKKESAILNQEKPKILSQNKGA